jgi:hypothetical protein
MTFVYCFFLGDVAFGEFGLWVLSWRWFVMQLQGIDHCSGYLFFFSCSFHFRDVCIHIIFGNFAVVEDMCNCYIHDINVFSLLKKN